MKKLLCFFGVASISISASTSLYFGLASTNLTSRTINNSIEEISTQKEPEIVNQLSNYFENTINQSRSIDSIENTDLVLEYIDYDHENSLLFLNLNALRNARISEELISILNTEEFIYHINISFQNGIFDYVDNRLVYVPYIVENELLEMNLKLQNESDLITSSRNSRSAGVVWTRAETRWWWFGRWSVELNNAATQRLIMSLDAWANVTDILSELLLLIPKAGPILSAILGIISLYISILNIAISSINRNNGIIIRATFVVVHNISAR